MSRWPLEEVPRRHNLQVNLKPHQQGIVRKVLNPNHAQAVTTVPRTGLIRLKEGGCIPDLI